VQRISNCGEISNAILTPQHIQKAKLDGSEQLYAPMEHGLIWYLSEQSADVDFILQSTE